MEYIELKTYPRQIAAFEIPKPDENIVGLYVILKPEARLEDILTQLRDQKIAIRHADVNEQREKGGLVINAFLDVSNSPQGIHGLQAFLEKLDCVEKLVISEGKPVLHQTSQFPIVNRNERVVIQSVKRMQYIKDQLERILTPSGLAVIFYNIGLENGKGMYQLFVQQFGSGTITPEKKLELFRNHNISGGVGVYDFSDFDLKNRSGIVRLYDDYECDGMTKSSSICHQSRGTLAGFLASEWPDRKVRVVELKCRATGDPHCEFAVGE